MKFPVSVHRIDDLIVLFQGEITEEFKRKLDRVEKTWEGKIASNSNPELKRTQIYLNGESEQLDYRIVSRQYDEETFKLFKVTIKHYAGAMGYEC
jgi:hypothetical protein